MSSEYIASVVNTCTFNELLSEMLKSREQTDLDTKILVSVSRVWSWCWPRLEGQNLSSESIVCPRLSSQGADVQ